MISPSQKGIALVLVLWVVVLLGIIAGAVSMTQRSGVALTANQRLERQGRALVDAGIRFMMLQLDNRNQPQEGNPWPVDGRLHPWPFGGRTVWIGAMPENARIDLNQVNDALLLSALRSLGLDEEEAVGVRDAILDWRDADDGVRPRGAEDEDYLAAGRPVGARDGRFMSVEELQQVKGITAELYKKLEPLLTVDGGQRTVNPAFASREVLRAIPGLDQELVEAYLAARNRALDAGEPVPPPVRGAGFFSRAAGSIYRILAEVDMPGGLRVQGEVVVNIQVKMPGGYRVLRRMPGNLISLGRAPGPEAED